MSVVADEGPAMPTYLSTYVGTQAGSHLYLSHIPTRGRQRVSISIG